MAIIGRLTQLVDNRLLIAVGFGATAAATFIFGSVDLEIARGSLFLPSVLSGIGIGFVFVPITTMAMGCSASCASRSRCC